MRRRGGQGCLGFTHPGIPLISTFHRNGLGLQQLLGSNRLPPRRGQPDLRRIHLCLGPLDRRNEGSWVDDEEHLSLADRLSGLETHLRQVARDARTDLDRFHGFNATAEGLRRRERDRLRRGDRHHRWRCGRSGGRWRFGPRTPGDELSHEAQCNPRANGGTQERNHGNSINRSNGRAGTVVTERLPTGAERCLG